MRLERLLASTTPIALALFMTSVSHAQETGLSPDQLLVEQLSFDEETISRVQSQMGDRLSPSEISALRRLMDMEEAARQNPIPPQVTNKVITIDRGESPTLDILQRYDTTLVFADRAGNPLNILSMRISDREAAELIPLYAGESGSAPTPPTSSVDQASSESPEELAIYGAPGDQAPQAIKAGQGPVNAIIVSPRQPLRSTNITVRVEGEDYPIVLTVQSHTSHTMESELAYVNEIRLDWKVDMANSIRMAGKYRVGEALEANMLSLLQGIPGPELSAVELEGELSSQVSLWKDATSRDNPTYFLRMADHLSPWNISIDDQSHDRMRGFTVIRLNGAPPKSIGFSNNGSYQTVTLVN